MQTLKHNIRHLFIAADQFFNVLFCMIFEWQEKQWADETFSAHCWRWEITGKRSWPRKIVDSLALCLGDKNHCRESFENERLQRQLPPEARGGGNDRE